MGKVLDEDLVYEILSVVAEIPAGCVAFRDNGCVDMKKHQWNE